MRTGSSQVADLKLRTSEKIAIAEQHFSKSCGIVIAEVLPASCGIALADSKKSCACPPLLVYHTAWSTKQAGSPRRIVRHAGWLTFWSTMDTGSAMQAVSTTQAVLTMQTKSILQAGSTVQDVSTMPADKPCRYGQLSRLDEPCRPGHRSDYKCRVYQPCGLKRFKISKLLSNFIHN